jgi:lipopolysaccharide export system permease protein
MILSELIRVFLLSLLGITGLLVMGAVVAEASQQGLNPSQLLAAIPLLIPSTLPYTIPATTLFATCVVYGRLANDNEILAIKSAGIHLRKVIGPAVVLGVSMSAVTMGLYWYLIPHTHYLLRTSFMNDAEEFLYSMLKRDRCIKMSTLNYAVWVRRVQGRRLEEALFKRRPPKSENYDVICRARDAELSVDLPNKLVRVHMHHCYLLSDQGQNRGYFQERSWDVPLPPNFGEQKEPKPRAMNYEELLDYQRKLREQMEENATEMATVAARLDQSNPPKDLPTHLDNLRSIQKLRQYQTYNVATELHMRPSLAVGCLCFVLVGCPVGIWLSRSDFLSAFITCFLPIILLYYPLLLCGTSYAKQGKLPPEIALWTANVFMGFIALILFRRLLRN